MPADPLHPPAAHPEHDPEVHGRGFGHGSPVTDLLDDLLRRGWSPPAGAFWGDRKHRSHPLVDTVETPNPADNSFPAFTVPGGEERRLETLTTTFVASAAVANRVPLLRLVRGGTIYLTIPATVTTVASSAVGYSWFAGESASAATGSVFVVQGIPKLWLAAGWSWTMGAAGLQAGDRWTSITARYSKRYVRAD